MYYEIHVDLGYCGYDEYFYAHGNGNITELDLDRLCDYLSNGFANEWIDDCLDEDAEMYEIEEFYAIARMLASYREMSDAEVFALKILDNYEIIEFYHKEEK